MPVKIKNSKSWFKERFSRFRPVVFLKKNLPFFIFIILISLSFVLGLWNIKRYEVFNQNGEDLDDKIENLIVENLHRNITGKNFFSIYSKDIEKDLERGISYIKSARVMKIVPNKLEVFVDTYQPRSLILDNNGQCKLLSQTGVVLERVCEDSEDTATCCVEYTSDTKYYIFKSDEAETAKLSGGKEQLLVMKVISNVVKVVESFGFNIREIVLEEKVLHITDIDGKTHIFTLSDSIDTQLARYFVVMGKVKGEGMEFSSIDVRFERPVVKN